ncbi:cadherin EGF LAG seven pass G type receptor [Echinococcus multilocularis]|uniref:Cadherin EGF LAG seven pass G type receptor n=1 Tax=Echinococcus multilocularis TaxID=6211 RepID=A0A068XZQ9_ECHMU|nr:cadherin EGF LAG seven pass G type receptor [Echinococcus multilocularis]
MVITKSIVVRIVFIVCINFIAFAVQDIDRISVNFFRKTYRRWNNRPLELHCPFSNPSHQLWYSSNTVYKAAFGCLDGADLSLFLSVFPDVENITFIGLNTSHQALCTFRLIGELVEGNALLLSSRSNENGRFEVKIFARPGTSLTFNTTICKTGVVRNGSCSSWDALGTSFTGEQVNRRHLDYFGVRYTVQARDGDRHQCMGSIDGRMHSFIVRVKADLDECEAAAAESIQLCRGECRNLFPSYRCPNDSYSIPCSDFKTEGWMCLPEERHYYPPSSVELDGIGTCELTANEGHHFCPLGAMDCIDSPYGPKCRSELQDSLVEASSKMGFNGAPTPGFQYSKGPPVDLNLLLRKVSTDKNLTYLVQKSGPLLWQNSERWIGTLGNVTKANFQLTSSTLFEERDEVSSENLLQSIEALLNIQTQQQAAAESSYPKSGQSFTEEPPVSASAVVQSASALLNVFSALSGDQDSPGFAIDTADEYTIQRNGLELRRIRLNKNQSDTQNESIVMHSLATSSDSSTALMITIPMRKLEPFLKKSNDSEFTKANTSLGDASFTNLDSDVYIIHTSDLISLFQLKMASKKERKEDVTCRIWDMLNAQGNAFESQTCQTYWIDGKYYECRCTPSRSGTFAVGLVYIMSSKDLKNLKNYGPSITIVNYVSSVITVIALSLFLFFTRFVGVFRLDQFHIALSLLLGTLVSLFIPHVPEDFEFLCAVIAVLVNYFPLCAFAWKFVFGLNALLMIVAPHTDFNGIFALRIVYIPVTICAYIGPALIVGLWFGMARQFKSGLGLCIGPDLLGYRWPLLAPITAVVLFNLLVLITVGFVVLRNYLAIRRSRVSKSTHLLVLAQLMLTLGIPYMLIYIQIISPVFMLLILPMGIALTAVFMFLLVAVIDDENRQLLHIFLTTMCPSGHHMNKYSGNGSNGRVNIADTIKSTALPSPDAFVVTDSGHHTHMTTSSSANNSTNHEYFARSRNRFAMEGDLATGILRQPIGDGSSGVGEEFKSAAVLVPLEVAQLPTQYYYNPQSPHHNAPVIRFESLHDLVMAPTSEFNDVGRIIQTPMPEVAYSEGIGTQHFYPKSRKQFVNKITTSPKFVNSYHMDSKSGGF